MKNFFKPIEKKTKTLKTFTFRKGNTALEFTLDINNERDLKDFDECLKEARADLEKEIKK